MVYGVYGLGLRGVRLNSSRLKGFKVLRVHGIGV